MPERKTRDSNMELLRLVAMLLVMMVHASYRALPPPTQEAIANGPVSMFLPGMASACAGRVCWSCCSRWRSLPCCV